MERFRTCDECSRHVRPAEPKCPFCGHVLEAAALMPVPRAPAGLSRAQRIALVAAVAGGGMLAACGDDSGPSTPGPRAGAGVAGATAGTSAGGSAAAGSGTAGKGAAGSPPIAVPVYGAPFPAPAGAGGAGGAGKSGSGAGGAAGAAGHAGAAGAGAGGAGGTAGTPAAAGSGGHMVQPLYGASPAYGVPPTPPKK